MATDARIGFRLDFHSADGTEARHIKISQELHEYAGPPGNAAGAAAGADAASAAGSAANGAPGGTGNGEGRPNENATTGAGEDGARDASEGLSPEEIRKALDEKAEEFREKGGEIYVEGPAGD